MTLRRKRYPIKLNLPRSIRKYGSGLASAVTGYNVARTLTSQRRKKKSVSSGRGITNEYDRKLIYKKRSMPRRFKKRWRRFKRKINAISEKSLGSKTVVENDAITLTLDLTSANSSAQAVMNVALYPLQSTNTWLKDVNNILANDTTVPTTGKLLFQSAVLDMTVCNTSSLNATTPRNASIPSLELDVYEIISSSDFSKLITPTTGDLVQVFGEGATDTGAIGGTGTSLTIQQRGVTPWDLPSALSEYRLKILKKTKYFLGPGQTMTYQIRDPRRHVVDKQYQQVQTGNIKNMTRWLFLVYKPTPCTSEFADTDFDVAQIRVGLTRKYFYKVNELSGDYDNYNI